MAGDGVAATPDAGGAAGAALAATIAPVIVLAAAYVVKIHML